MPRSVSIENYEPQWLAEGGRYRYGMGVSIICPTHGGHRISFWFDNPADGDRPTERPVRLFHRIGGSLVEMTITNLPGRGEALDVRGHWSGYVVGGVVSTARHTDDETTDPGLH